LGSLAHFMSIDTIAPYREAGFAILWLHPRSKRPIGKEWSEAPVATLDTLRRTYASGNNVGVRLGEPSALSAGGYLHVLDIDIRDTSQAEDAWTALRALFPDVDIDSLPCVQSGSGGESRHLYFIASKAFFGKKLAVSEGKYRGADGCWHYDWEVELFGTGKQVAMPPSIHPDTGKPYVWLRSFPLDLLPLGLGPYIPSEAIERLAVAETGTFEFETRDPLTFEPGQLERDLDALPIERLDDYHDWITLGQALHHQFGAGAEGFDLWVTHSRRSEKFDDTASGLRTMRLKWRGFGRNRRQPVTMATVRQWVLDARRTAFVSEFSDDLPDAFDDDDDDTGPVNPDALSAMLGLLGDAPAADPLAGFDTKAADAVTDDWHFLLDFNEEGAIRPTLHNVGLIVRNDPRLVAVIQFNEFIQETVQRRPPGQKPPRRANAAKPTLQLEGPVWEVSDPLNGVLWSTDRDNAIRAILEAPKTQGGYGIKVTDRDLRAAIDIAARANPFHPVREYLSSLSWDGRPRVDTFLIRYLGAPDNAYIRAVGRLALLGAVTRVFEPGHKFDFVPILEGLQGKRKSTFIRLLAKHWFCELEGTWADRKGMVEKMLGSWLLEIPELAGFSKYDVQEIKAFVSASVDKVRLSYDRRAREFPRQAVFWGSTNEGAYLKDQSGGRRFWPVACSVDLIDTKAFESEVDHLWAETVVIYREMRRTQPRGTLPLYLGGDALREAERLQESRRNETVEDIYHAKIEAWLNQPINDGGFDPIDAPPRYRTKTCAHQIWVECLRKDLTAIRDADTQVIGRAIRRCAGWESTGTREKIEGYGRSRTYTKSDANSTADRLLA